MTAGFIDESKNEAIDSLSLRSNSRVLMLIRKSTRGILCFHFGPFKVLWHRRELLWTFSQPLIAHPIWAKESILTAPKRVKTESTRSFNDHLTVDDKRLLLWVAFPKKHFLRTIFLPLWPCLRSPPTETQTSTNTSEVDIWTLSYLRFQFSTWWVFFWLLLRLLCFHSSEAVYEFNDSDRGPRRILLVFVN